MLPTSTRVSISSSTSTPITADALALFLPEKSKALPTTFLSQAERKSAHQLISSNLARGKAREIASDLLKSKDDDEEKSTPLQLTLLTPQAGRKSIDASIRHAQIIADSQNIARTIASRPGNEINPPALAKVAQQLAREVGLTSKILDDKELKRLGMGGILAVGQGSSLTPPRLIVLEYHPVGARHASPS